jgi:hypothetical protein
MRRIKKEIQITYNQKIGILALFPIICFLLVLIFGREELLEGYSRILRHSGVLITDYIYVGGFYSTLFNVIIVSIINLAIIYYFKIPINGLIFAAYFVAIGFAFFGKTAINILPIYIGGLLYCRYEKISYRNIFGVMMFSAGLAPLVSFLVFNLNLGNYGNIFFGVLAGIIVGFIMTPLSSHMLKFHDGYNLYNIGFTAGILGNLCASVIRGRGLEIKKYYLLSQDYDFELKLLLTIVFCIYILIGYYINLNSFQGYDMLMSTGGRLITDHILTEGFGISLLNSGILGLLSIAFTSAIGATLNGALVAGIFTVFAFGAFGKHPVNCIPIVLGVLLASYIKVWEFDSFNVALSALFGTTLAPIAGVHGPFLGILSGFLHLFVVNNIGVIHGGMNLYNNGFSGGMVAGILVPLIHKFNLGEKFNDRKD